MAKNFDPNMYESIEPVVVNTEMLRAAVIEQGPKGEAGRLFAIDGVVLEEVTNIRLEFLKILRIDHIWMMTSLVKLKLGNNLIEKIENLEQLVNLKDLDLSFNNIEVIENLEHLVKLEVLTLFHNKITKMENMETLVNLMIFSIGSNLIEDWDNVLYLRQFRVLRSLNMEGNPCCKKENFREYIYAYMPKLTYYAYHMIQTNERDAARKVFGEKLLEFEEEDAQVQAVIDAKEKDVKDAAFYSKIFMENLNSDQLFRQMYEDDIVGISLSKMNEETEELYKEYYENYDKVIRDLFDFGLKQADIRNEEIRQFEDCINEAKDRCKGRSRLIIDEFLVTKNELFPQVRELVSSMDSDEEDEEKIADFFHKMESYNDHFNDFCQKTWHELMDLEMTLHEQLEDTIKCFDENIREITNSFVENAQSYFVQMRIFESAYYEQVQDIAIRIQTNMTLRLDGPVIVVPPDLQELMGDREALTFAMATSHEQHMRIIDEREQALIKHGGDWCNHLCNNWKKSEKERNRAKILEINHFLDVQREEFEEIQEKEEE